MTEGIPSSSISAEGQLSPAPPLVHESSDPSSNLESLSEEDVRRCLKDAEELKEDGNEHFRGKRWNEALAIYRSALGRLPGRKSKTPLSTRKGKEQETLDELDQEETGSKTGTSGLEGKLPSPVPEPVQTALELECAKARATLNANIGACLVKLEEHKEAVAACTEALLDDPQYIKALQRRASSNDILNTWSSLSSAQEDYNKLLTLLPPSSPQIVEIRRILKALKPRIEAAQKSETAEMLDKLKGLGNSFLGNFGLSTDNFQFIPNGQGGYSMNFVK